MANDELIWNGDDHDRALGVTHHVFGYAPDERMLEPCAAMCGGNDEINVGLAGCCADFLGRMASADFGLNRHAPQNIHLLKRVHLYPGCFFHGFYQRREAGARAVKEHVIDIWIGHMKEAKCGLKTLCQKRRVLRPREGTC
jgi:hypothetical protein